MNTSEANNNEVLDYPNENDGAMYHCGRTPIQEFYAEQNIFITGCTGFLGKILTEKLLRSCQDISTLYILIRSKKGKSVHSRLEDLFQDRVFDRLKKEVPKFRDKIVAVNGDCSVEGLGLSEADRNTLIQEVSIVFHVAATVRFDEKLNLATAINVRSTADILDMCKSMQKLKAFMHVSTAYGNCHLDVIDECFYQYPTTYENVSALVNAMPENIIDQITYKVIEKWPNTYTFTKAIAEGVIRDKNDGLPIGIFRPAIVVSTAYEPLKGWIDNLYGPTGIVAAAGSGILRVMHCDPKVNANIVPVDLTVNALIASAWDVHVQSKRRGEDMLIYNYVSTVEAPLNWTKYRLLNKDYIDAYPLSTCIWYLSFTMIKYKPLYTIACLLLHLLPALLVDTVRVCFGKKPRLWKIYEKVHKFTKVISYFCTRQWTFRNDNVQAMWLRLSKGDQQIFRFSMRGFDWTSYFTTYLRGIRIYLMNDDLETLPESKIRWKRLYWLHQALKASIVLAGIWVAWRIVCMTALS
ncbi:hypothetical protein KM043_004245 [Ampulex compressa]|nr:hypothetical protein KM043_004245 [Ampulex compressa]